MRPHLLLGLASLLFAPFSHAAERVGAWPSFAANQAHTGRAHGVGRMKSPTIHAQKYLGGTLPSWQLAIADIDQDGTSDAMFLRGGRLTAELFGKGTAFVGGLEGVRAVLGVWDLDGDGVPEAVLDTERGAEIRDAKSGALYYRFLRDLPKSAAFVPESKLLLLSSSHKELVAYAFPAGASAPMERYRLPTENATSILALDFDGDGVRDLLRTTDAAFLLHDLHTGVEKGRTTEAFPPAYFFGVTAGNLDENPGLEVVAVDTSYLYSPWTRVFALGVREGKLTELWSRAVEAPRALDADFVLSADSVVDLDGDGTMEVVVASLEAGTFSTRVLDGATGREKAALEGELLVGIADIDRDGKPNIVTRKSPGADRTPRSTSISTHRLEQGAIATSPLHVEGFEILDATAPSEASFGLPRPFSLESDEGPLFLARRVGAPETLHALSLTAGTSQKAYRAASAMERVSPSLGGGLYAFEADGHLVHLDRDLREDARHEAGTYANWTFAAPLTHRKNTMLAATSDGRVLWMDGTILSPGGEPRVTFQAARQVVAPDRARFGMPHGYVSVTGAVSPAVVALAAEDDHEVLVGHDESGVEVWRTDLAPGTHVAPPGPYVIDLTADGHPDLLVPLVNVHSLFSYAVYDGKTGTLVRSTPLTTISPEPIPDQMLVGTFADANGDGRLDLVAPLHNTGLLAVDVGASPMKSLWTRASGPGEVMVNGTLGVAELDGEPGVDLFRANGHNAFGGYARLRPDGTVAAYSDEGLSPTHGADSNVPALTRRGSAMDLVTTGMSGDALSRVRRLAGDTLKTVWQVYAENGEVTAAPPAIPSRLCSPIVLDVDDNGSEDVVFGSEDGWVYALHAGDGARVFASFVGAPVRSIIAADVDLDDGLELLVSTDDGRLLALDDSYAAERETAPDGGASVDGGHAGADADAAAGADAGAGSDAGPPCAPSPPVNSGCGCTQAGDPAPLSFFASFLGLLWARTRKRRA